MPTPIGNLQDITERARAVLSAVGVIAAEDTRQCRKLLGLLGVPAPTLIAVHEHNERDQAPALLARLQAGEDIALVSDAGTPQVSDPGHVLLRTLWETPTERRPRVVPLPGPSAASTLLSACPIPLTDYVFAGFLPAKGKTRRAAIEALLARPAATLLFESVHRITQLLDDIAALAPDRLLFIGRELTKLHESLLYGTAPECKHQLTARDAVRGEFALVVAGSGEERDVGAATALLDVLLEELPPAQAARLTARATGASKRALYQQALARKPDQESE
ncbi:MAG: 16S rRNA (cytidine(1402)-2'-O)-methyltransferase [Pseudomonadota bacterium]